VIALAVECRAQGGGWHLHGEWYMKKEKAIQVLIVDDHAIVRQGIRSMLEGYPDIHVVGEARNGLEAIFLVEKFRPSIVLMDINMPKMNGIEATAQITNGYPDTSIIGLSVNATTQSHEAIKQAGAVQLLPKETAVEELYAAICQAVTNRETSRSPSLHEQL
jgi:DNA-binding NarL/FixJ family response regulator